MRIGLSFDLKDEVILGGAEPVDDALEEYDCRETVDIIASAVESRGHSAVRLGGGRGFLKSILNEEVDLVFNIAEGWGNYRSRESQVPAILEMLNIPYTGSDPACLALCLDKPMTKTVVSMSGIRTPKWRVVKSVEELARTSWIGFPFPAFLKPAHEGSSKGIHANSRVATPEQLRATATLLLKNYAQPILVEEFIEGDEVTVGLVGNSPPKVIGLMRILSKKPAGPMVYSVDVKRDWQRLVDYECPARIEKRVVVEIERASVKAFEVLGCRDFARIDFRVTPKGTPYFLEINPLAGLGTYSDLVIMAIKSAWSHQQLICTVLDAALERYPQCVRV
jgi:D-alanine-D-alanine ligase